MVDRLTDDELDALETEQPRPAAEIRELRDLVDTLRRYRDKATREVRADNARLRTELEDAMKRPRVFGPVEEKPFALTEN